MRCVTEDVRQKFSWKRQAYLFCFELIPAKWKRTMRSFKMPPFCVIFTSEMLTFQFLCACKIFRALEPCAFTLRLYSLCRVFCLNSPGSCAFEWVERLERNRKLTRARHVSGGKSDHSINDRMKWWKFFAGQTGILECRSCTVIENLPLTLFAINIFIERGHVKPCLKVLKTCQRTVTCDFELRVSNVNPDDVSISFSCNCWTK